MLVRFVEQASGTLLWSEERSSVCVSYRNPTPKVPLGGIYRQANSKRRATWWISRIDDSEPVVAAFIEPSNERAKRRVKRRATPTPKGPADAE